jgi:hypothetical protein
VSRLLVIHANLGETPIGPALHSHAIRRSQESGRLLEPSCRCGTVCQAAEWVLDPPAVTGFPEQLETVPEVARRHLASGCGKGRGHISCMNAEAT